MKSIIKKLIDKIKKLIYKLIANVVPIMEIIVLVGLAILPSKMELMNIIREQLALPTDLEGVIVYYVFTQGDVVIGIALAATVLFRIVRPLNKDKMFNKGVLYKNYPYWWYCLCAKILGYTKCNLVMVPINMQFKLVINDTFTTFYTGDVEEKKEDDIEVIRDGKIENSDEINLIIADTYPIDKSQLPEVKKKLPTIKITRNNSIDHNRYKSDELVKNVVIEVGNLPVNSRKINIYATTNPENTMNIAKKAFSSGERSNLDLVTVFQQGNDPLRKFKEKGIVVYKRR